MSRSTRPPFRQGYTLGASAKPRRAGSLLFEARRAVRIVKAKRRFEIGLAQSEADESEARMSRSASATLRS
jgi:hypothetical protein